MTTAGSRLWMVALAAGYARRMGEQKLLLPDAAGRPIIEHTIQTLCEAATQVRAEGVCVVCNQAYERVASALADLPVQIVWNEHPELGMSESLKNGIAYVGSKGAEAALVALGDQPDLSVEVVERVTSAWRREGAPIVQPRYRSVPGHPVLFGCALFDELLQLRGDEGGRSVLKAHANDRHFVDIDANVLPDVDTPSDYEAFLHRSSNQ